MFTSEEGHSISDFNLMCEDERARRVRELVTETEHLLTVASRLRPSCTDSRYTEVSS